MTKLYRHGDLTFEPIDKLPDGLTASDTKTLLATGSGGNPHTFKGGMFYPETAGSNVIGYLQAQNTKLYHKKHGIKKIGGLKEAILPNGVYKLTRQVEKTHEGMKIVID